MKFDEGQNYVLHPDSTHKYWANISFGRLQEYVARCGEHFNVVIASRAGDEGDFYAIPYAALKHALKESFLSHDKTGRRRWVAAILSHQLRVGRYPVPIDVGAYWGCRAAVANPGSVEPATAAESNDYAIENRKAEIEQRQKQSTFRRRTVKNFEKRCCLSGICEDALLVASHIVPWAKRIDTRLDPSNGLLLYCSYDRLFDKGLISFDENLRVVVVPWVELCSPPLRLILRGLNGQQARHPMKWPIKPEYLAYHRAVVFRARPDAEGASGSDKQKRQLPKRLEEAPTPGDGGGKRARKSKSP